MTDRDHLHEPEHWAVKPALYALAFVAMLFIAGGLEVLYLWWQS